MPAMPHPHCSCQLPVGPGYVEEKSAARGSEPRSRPSPGSNPLPRAPLHQPICVSQDCPSSPAEQLEGGEHP